MARLMSACVGIVLSFAGSAFAEERVRVLTSYPEEVFAKFEQAFERRHPEVNVEFVWRMPHDALPYLRGAGRGTVDVYWAAAYRNFVTLAAEGAFDAVDVDRAQVPSEVGAFRLSDSQGRFVAVELARFGIVTSPSYLAARGLPVPSEWSDVADPRFAGHVVLPIPSKVGFAANMVDTVLQAHGWERGWALVSRVAANGRLMDAGSTFITDEIGAGRAGVGLTIDFFARSAIARGAPLAFRYPSTGGYSFAHAAVVRDAPNASGAARFVAFLISREGQALLGDPEIRKLPIRPDAYADVPTDCNPFLEPDSPTLRYDPNLGVRRFALVSALFDQLVTERHEALAAAWRAYAEAERVVSQRAAPEELSLLDRARGLLEALPVSAVEAQQEALPALFDRRRRDPAADAEARRLEASWREFFARNSAEAERLMASARAAAAER